MLFKRKATRWRITREGLYSTRQKMKENARYVECTKRVVYTIAGSVGETEDKIKICSLTA